MQAIFDTSFLKYLPSLKENEGFYFLLFIRKKWIKLYYPEADFPAQEIVLTHFVIDYTDFKKGEDYVISKINNYLAVLDDKYTRIKLIKGKPYTVSELFKRFPKAISLTFVYEPRDVVKATKRLVSDYVKKFMYQNYDVGELLKFQNKWKSYVHSTARSGKPKYVMIDIDFNENLTFEQLQFVYENLYFPNIVYAVSTPSNGLHIILEIDKTVEEEVFKKKHRIIKTLAGVLDAKEVKIATFTQTHAPFHPNVKILNASEVKI